MPGRYLVELPLRALSRRDRAKPAMLERRYHHPAASIWSDTPIIALGDRGCIVGHLFSRTIPSRRIRRLDSGALDRIFHTDGHALLTDYWGGYVAIYISPTGDVSLLRDPSGMLPCYFLRDADRILVSSDIFDLAVRGAAGVDPVEVARFLGSADARGRNTCIAEVQELIAGECLSVASGHSAIERWWSPWNFVNQPAWHSYADAAAQLRETAMDCIGIWASCFESILLGVSGGLDSSIVAAATNRRSAALRCLTMVEPDAEGDERQYARALTDALGVPLLAREYDLAAIDIARAVRPNHPWPHAPYFMQAIETVHQSIDQERAIDAYFSGNGGDNVFCSLRTASPLVDRFLAEGPQPGLAATLRDLCDLTDTDKATVLRYAWKKYRQRANRPSVRYDFAGLSGDAIATLKKGTAEHPWLKAPTGALPGKCGHIRLLMRAQKSLELYPRKTCPPHIAPFLSQPLVELCLSIPTWFWIAGGINRAPARAAFKDILPDILLRRTSKGGPSGFTQRIYDAKSGEARDMLRHGVLASAGMLDLDFLDEPEDPSWRGIDRTQRILALCAAETWVRWWRDPSLV